MSDVSPPVSPLRDGQTSSPEHYHHNSQAPPRERHRRHSSSSSSGGGGDKRRSPTGASPRECSPTDSKRKRGGEEVPAPKRATALSPSPASARRDGDELKEWDRRGRRTREKEGPSPKRIKGEYADGEARDRDRGRDRGRKKVSQDRDRDPPKGGEAEAQLRAPRNREREKERERERTAGRPRRNSSTNAEDHPRKPSRSSLPLHESDSKAPSNPSSKSAPPSSPLLTEGRLHPPNCLCINSPPDLFSFREPASCFSGQLCSRSHTLVRPHPPRAWLVL